MISVYFFQGFEETDLVVLAVPAGVGEYIKYAEKSLLRYAYCKAIATYLYKKIERCS